MIQAKAVQSLADAHRQDLLASARPRRVSRRQLGQTSDHRARPRPAAGFPVSGGGTPRRAVAPRIGAWLIEFGTRLGGATVRTS
jgi:hypothetical protein